MTSTRVARLRQALLYGACFSGFMGVLNLYTGLNRPTIADMRTLDIVHLLATGALLGVCLLAVGLYFGILRHAAAADSEPGATPDRQE